MVAIALEKNFCRVISAMIIQLHQKHLENCFTMSKPIEKYFFFAELRPKLSFKKTKKANQLDGIDTNKNPLFKK